MHGSYDNLVRRNVLGVNPCPRGTSDAEFQALQMHRAHPSRRLVYSFEPLGAIGETAYNLKNIIQGHVDVPLSENGRKQAKLLAVRLQNQKYSHVYASDLLRAYQTAESVLDQNAYSNVSITKDNRLRERKFGEVEGKTFKYLREEAKKVNQPIYQFTPPGGETVIQVYHRAITFFQNLCQEMIAKELLQEKSKHEAKRQKCEGFVDVPISEKPQSTNLFEKVKTNSDCDKPETTEKCNDSGEKSSSSLDISTPDFIHEEKLARQNIPTADLTRKAAAEASLAFETFSNCNEKINSEMVKKYDVNSNLPSDMKSLSFAKVPQDGASNSSSNGPSTDQKQFKLSFSDSSIRSHVHRSCGSHMDLQDECPNVSLSPLIEKQVSPFCEVTKMRTCSTRKISVDSCDDDDLPPAIAANILIASHGGFIRELLRYFVEELDCAVPGGKAQALRTSPNTGISRFTVSIQPSDDKIRVTCLDIHDKDHLNEHSEYS
ncbi:Fructose-2,6-bisphosphatase TIGAR [Nymphon striatum]|nr:Fructose-2,6-bisphosphatase TIGAR [Nymphon striatum]